MMTGMTRWEVCSFVIVILYKLRHPGMNSKYTVNHLDMMDRMKVMIIIT